MRRTRAVAALGMLVVVAGCSSSGAAVKPSPSPSRQAAAKPSPLPSPSPASPCATPGGAPSGNIPSAFPVALAFAPDGRLFWAERGGTIKVWQSGAAQDFATVSTVTTQPGGGYSERGLLGLAVSPTFAQDRFVYAMYSEPDYAHQTVVRWTDCLGKGTARTTIVANLPTGADCCHKGGRLAFGTDGMLYVTLGDNHSAPSAQDSCDVRGKILRYAPDGSVPPGNLCGAVYAKGLRNPFGLAFSPTQLFVTNNGPSGDAGSPSTGYDTVYDVTAGGNYSWPTCYGYSHPLSAPACAGSGPLWSSEGSTVVPTGATYISASGPPGLAGHFVFCTFNGGGRIYEGPQSVAAALPHCKLDIKESPDHVLYYSDTSAIYRYPG
jgi:glucose/arabinose dehydrogenase